MLARGSGAARIIGFITEPAVITRILGHLKRPGIDAHAGPWTGAAATRQEPERRFIRRRLKELARWSVRVLRLNADTAIPPRRNTS